MTKETYTDKEEIQCQDYKIKQTNYYVSDYEGNMSDFSDFQNFNFWNLKEYNGQFYRLTFNERTAQVQRYNMDIEKKEGMVINLDQYITLHKYIYSYQIFPRS